MPVLVALAAVRWVLVKMRASEDWPAPGGAVGGEGERGGHGIGGGVVFLIGDGDAGVAAIGAERGGAVEADLVGSGTIVGIEQGKCGVGRRPAAGVGGNVGAPGAVDAGPAAGHFHGIGEHEAVVVIGGGASIDADGGGGFDDLLRGAGAGPEEVGLGGASGLVIIDLDGVGLAGDEVDGAVVGGGGVSGPIVDQRLAVDDDADAIVGDGGEGVGFGVSGTDAAGPFGGPVGAGEIGEAGGGGTGGAGAVPVGIDADIGAGEGGGAREGGVGVVLAEQSRADKTAGGGKELAGLHAIKETGGNRF